MTREVAAGNGNRPACARWSRILLPLFSIPAWTACAAFHPPPQVHHYVHPSLMQDSAAELPGDIIVLPPVIRVITMSSGKPPVLDERKSADASALMAEALRAGAASVGSLRPQPMPELSDDERRVLEDHARLLSTVADVGQSLVEGMKWPRSGHRWRARYEEFDCTLGTGMRFVAERSGVRWALVALGACWAQAEQELTPWTMTPFGPVPSPVNGARLTVGVVDLESGAVLWAHSSAPGMGMFGSKPSNLTKPEIARALVDRALEEYPNVHAFRDLWRY